MTVGARLLRSTRGAAAVEMALVTPLLLIIMMGSFELGNYFMNEHKLVKAVRDGARFAGRQAFGSYTCPSTIDSTVVTNTKNVVMTGVLSGGSNRIVNWNASSITLSLNCFTATGGQDMLGIYRNSTGGSVGAPVVTVSATVLYTPVLASFGFRGVGFNLNARQQAAVMGL
jgi:Flp pilus assembly protein TadG